MPDVCTLGAIEYRDDRLGYLLTAIGVAGTVASLQLDSFNPGPVSTGCKSCQGYQ